MSKEYKITDEELLRGAESCPDVKAALKKMFPDADAWKKKGPEDITRQCSFTIDEAGDIVIHHDGNLIGFFHFKRESIEHNATAQPVDLSLYRGYEVKSGHIFRKAQ